MLSARAKYSGPHSPTEALVLNYTTRQRSRFVASSTLGRELAVILPRGSKLACGDRLSVEDGSVVRVEAIAESVTLVECPTWGDVARACYHLGNRHAPVQIGEGGVTYLVDHVLDDLMIAIGLRVAHAHLPFEPEPGAYAQHRWGAPRVVGSVSTRELADG